ncbi:hypothetical protein amb1136 [Paramagnetospirillum magneticum AMB-1]|uniref:Uncharacterized protein n=1 Tax=Paramagnetospirillum magneticum (strain ATCC 700264 / AMB-1) TaxID=342108 RepID=Q2W885_PARM1|nr:hypothetical protein amb1136 [Paramagnetospirillum magneticum AMB-1]
MFFAFRFCVDLGAVYFWRIQAFVLQWRAIGKYKA